MEQEEPGDHPTIRVQGLTTSLLWDSGLPRSPPFKRRLLVVMFLPFVYLVVSNLLGPFESNLMKLLIFPTNPGERSSWSASAPLPQAKDSECLPKLHTEMDNS